MNDARSTSSTGGWQVDRERDPGVFVRYLEASSESRLMRDVVSQRLQKYRVQDARSVVDIGCGIGTHVRMLADATEPDALVVGFDASSTLLRTARQRTSGRARFVRGDAHHLPFASHSFELAWLERVLVHLSDPAQVLNEVARVLAPGGRVLIAEADYAGLLLDCEDQTQWLALEQRWLANLRHPRIGRQLAKLLHRAAFDRVQLDLELRSFESLELFLRTTGLERHSEALTLEGKLDAHHAEAFWQEQRARDRDGCFFAAIPFVVAHATREPRSSTTETAAPERATAVLGLPRAERLFKSARPDSDEVIRVEPVVPDHPLVFERVSLRGGGALILTGPSSCGKGHVADVLCKVLSIPANRHLSMGEILRDTVARVRSQPGFADELATRCEISAKTNVLDCVDTTDELAAKVRQHVDELERLFGRRGMAQFTSQTEWLEFCVTRGLLVPNRWTHLLIEAGIDRVLQESDGPLILDGYPRTVRAAEHLIAFLQLRAVPVVKVFHLSISKQEMLSRAGTRGRHDDDMQALLSRYEFYVEKVQPSVDYLKHVLPANTIALIDAHQPVYDAVDADRTLNLGRSVANVAASALLSLGAPRGVVRDLILHHARAAPTNV